MKVKVKKQWNHCYLPKRNRKNWVCEKIDLEVTANVREVTAKDAPIAFIVLEYGEFPSTVRLYKNRLYRDNFEFWREYENPKDYSSDFKHRTYGKDLSGLSAKLASNLTSIVPSSEEEARAEVKKRASDYLIVDGILYKHTFEPYYSITTFGLGNNHGGTGMFVRYIYKGAKHSDLPSAIYPATKRDEAVHAALTVAIGRGDDKSVDHLRKGGNGHIIVLKPECCKFRFPKHDLYKFIKDEEIKQRLIDMVNSAGGALPYDNLVADVLHPDDYKEVMERINAETGLDLPVRREEPVTDKIAD